MLTLASFPRLLSYASNECKIQTQPFFFILCIHELLMYSNLKDERPPRIPELVFISAEFSKE